MSMRYDAGMTHLEMGRRLGESEHLQKAKKILSEISVDLDLVKGERVSEAVIRG